MDPLCCQTELQKAVERQETGAHCVSLCLSVSLCVFRGDGGSAGAAAFFRPNGVALDTRLANAGQKAAATPTSANPVFIFFCRGKPTATYPKEDCPFVPWPLRFWELGFYPSSWCRFSSRIVAPKIGIEARKPSRVDKSPLHPKIN